MQFSNVKQLERPSGKRSEREKKREALASDNQVGRVSGAARWLPWLPALSLSGVYGCLSASAEPEADSLPI